VEIKVRDNGLGMNPKILHKIYQPFYTTKPTGEGIGLGLSLTYDIITKGHGGEMHVETEEGEYAEFTLLIPWKEEDKQPEKESYQEQQEAISS
jgi:signal transduction histidine kinase